MRFSSFSDLVVFDGTSAFVCSPSDFDSSEMEMVKGFHCFEAASEFCDEYELSI